LHHPRPCRQNVGGCCHNPLLLDYICIVVQTHRACSDTRNQESIPSPFA
jgi:hypothetical protein